MNSKLHIILAQALMFFLSGVLSAQTIGTNAPSKKIRLFNGKDLDNWIFVLKDPAANPQEVFTVENGVIHISGNPFGYMRTKDAFANYTLHLQWRWPDEATNSGVFIHTQLPDAVWPGCIECQLMAGNAGDFICMGGTDMDERVDKTNIVVKKSGESNEKQVGKWNTMEVICKDNTMKVYVNGLLQNKASGVTLSKGSICLQSEGKDIEFRKVYLTIF